MEQNAAHDAAETINELLLTLIDGEGVESIDIDEAIEVRDNVRDLANRVKNQQIDEREHTLSVGDFGIDAQEPTASAEANTVQVLELTHTPANEFETEEGKLVSEYSTNTYYDPESLVVGVSYPNMSSGQDKWYMPEDRVRGPVFAHE